MKCRVLNNGWCEITQGYSSQHNAIDLVGGGYTLDYIVAHSDGKVIFCQDGLGNMKGSTGNESYGNCVKIDHGNGYATLYAHMAKGLLVSNGQYVKKGQRIGYMSDSGNAYGGHLHWEVWKNGVRINPTEFIDSDFINNKLSIEYQTYDNVQKEWLPIVKDLQDYAGNFGHSVGGFRAKSNDSTITIQSHMKNGVWVEAISKWDNTDNGYSGIYGREIDMVMIKSSKGTARYRVHTINSGWLDWVQKFDINDEVSGMAGNWGEPIDGMQIEII